MSDIQKQIAQLIVDNYQQMSDADLTRLILQELDYPTTASAVRQRRQRLGLKKEKYNRYNYPSPIVTPPDDEQVSKWERTIARQEETIADLKKRHKAQTKAAADVEIVLEALDRLLPDFTWSGRPKAQPKQKSPAKGAEAVLLLSDLHFGAIVDPEEVGGLNAFNIEIAQARLEHVFDRVIDLATNHLNTSKVHICLMGDLVSGLIHDELEITNEITVPEQTVIAADALQVGIQRVVDAVGAVEVVSVSGNHGRLRHQKRASQRQVESFDWLAAQMIAKGLASDGRIGFTIPRTPWMIHQAGSLNLLIYHGDHIKSWAGIPAYGISRDVFRKKTLLIDHDIDFDMVCMGHMHQHGVLPITANLRAVMNGSLIGMDPYADSLSLGGNPSQTLFGVHPDYGITGMFEIKVGYLA